MRKLVYVGVAALSAVTLVGIGCSSSDNKASGTGGAPAGDTGGASSNSTSLGGATSSSGGATSASASGGAPVTGGSTSTSTSVSNVGGSSMVAGGNLVNEDCEAGGADSMGVVGGFYVYGDQDEEHPNGQSCTIPASGTSACEQADGGGTTGVCLAGSTIKDSTYAAWGCGIGLSLNAPEGDGEKLKYSGPATCFELTFTGTTGGLTLRVGFTQYADPSKAGQGVAPFKTVKAFTDGWTGKVCFEDVTCPNWPTAPDQGCPADMVATPSSSYDMQIQVPGGDSAATYNFCLTKVIPLKPAS